MIKSHHLKDLKSSGLSDEIIKTSEIFSTDSTEYLIGFEVGSSLVFPYGDNYYRVKPDKPFVNGKGSFAKYLTPKGKPNKLYIPSKVKLTLQNSKIPLFFTEGEKKALKATQEGFYCIGLVGVWGWKKKAENGDTEKLIDDFDEINFENREIYIVFDSDRKDNPLIRQGEYRFGVLLKSKGANVKIAILPHSLDGEKQGIDDFLVNEGVQEFKKIIAISLPVKDSTQREVGGNLYKFCEDGYKKIKVLKNKKTGESEKISEDITNFTIHYNKLIKIEEENLTIYKGFIKAKSTERILPFSWEVSREENLTKYIQNEIQKTVGLLCSPYQLELVKNLASYFNYGAREIVSVSSLGYHKGKFITPTFIIENGEIKENKNIPLNLTKARYTRKYDFLFCDKKELPEIGKFILDEVVEFHYKSYTLPLLGIIGLAPIQHLLKLPNFVVFIEGVTEAGKTIVLKLFMNFFADQSEDEGLPSISSTITDLEIDGYFTKDSIYPIDDFKLENIRDKNVITIIQNAHDRHGRGRRFKDLRKQVDYYIRGIPIFTGEEIFQNIASSISRMFILRVPPKTFSLDLIKKVFSKRDLLRKITPHYIAWTQRNMEEIKLRSIFLLPMERRTGQFASQILTGLGSFLIFLEKVCNIERERLVNLAKDAMESLTSSVSYTVERMQAEKKEEIFIEGLKALLSAGNITFGENEKIQIQKVGFYDKEMNIYYVIPEIAIQEVSKLTKTMFSIRSLGKNLKEAEYLAEIRKDGNPSVIKRYKGIPQSYWAIKGDLIGFSEGVVSEIL